MKHNQNNRRQRPRGNGRRYPNQKGGSFESSGPEAKVRGTAQQVLEKYQALARDAYSAGDRILAEGYMQHAEHYYRIISLENESAGRDNNRPRSNNSNQDDMDMDDQNDDSNYDNNNHYNDNQGQRSDHQAQRNEQVANGSNRHRHRDANGNQRDPSEDHSESDEAEVEAVVILEQPTDETVKVAAPRKPRQRRPRKVEQPAVDPMESLAAD
jgi:hypothetical protein